MEEQRLSIKDKIYVGALVSICEKMDDFVESKNFDMDIAKKLQKKYCKLAEKTYGDKSRSEKDIDSWCLAFSHAYEPSHTIFQMHVLANLQENKMEALNYVI